MASISMRSKTGMVRIELAEDESSDSAAARLNAAVMAAGGYPEPPKESRQQRRARARKVKPAAPPTRDQEMAARGMLECHLCRNWVPASRAAAERHAERCAAVAPMEMTQ